MISSWRNSVFLKICTPGRCVSRRKSTSRARSHQFVCTYCILASFVVWWYWSCFHRIWKFFSGTLFSTGRLVCKYSRAVASRPFSFPTILSLIESPDIFPEYTIRRLLLTWNTFNSSPYGVGRGWRWGVHLHTVFQSRHEFTYER